MRVSLMITCVVDVVAPEVGEASVRVLRATGWRVVNVLTKEWHERPEAAI